MTSRLVRRLALFACLGFPLEPSRAFAQVSPDAAARFQALSEGQ